VEGKTILKRRARATHQSLRENNGGRFLLLRVDCYYCIRVLENAWRWTITFQFNITFHLIRNSVTS